MGWLTLIITALRLTGSFFDLWKEKNGERAQEKREALNEVIKGAEVSDRSRITAGFDRYNRLRKRKS